MLIQPIKEGFVIDHQLGVDFCKAVERTNPKNEYIYMACDGHTFSMFAQSHMAVVSVNVAAEGGMHFWVGVDSVRFVALFKRLYAGSDIVIKPTERRVVVQEDNISVKFPVVQFHQMLTFPQFELIPGEEATWLVHALSSCYSVLSKSKRWAGILVDNTGAVARVMKITESAIKVLASTKLSCASSRFIVPDSMANALGGFKDSVVDLFLSPNHLGVTLQNNIFVYAPLLVDDYPPQYLNDLGLLDDLPQMLPAFSFPDRYVFDCESLVGVLSLVSGVVGQQEPQVKCSSVGYAAKTEKPVWQIGAKTFNGCEAMEKIQAIEGSPPQMQPFMIHASRFLGCLKSYGETVYLYNSKEQHLVVTDDESCSDVTLLFKSI